VSSKDKRREADDQGRNAREWGDQPKRSTPLVPRQPLELLKWWDSLDRPWSGGCATFSHCDSISDLLRLGLTRRLADRQSSRRRAGPSG